MIEAKTIQKYSTKKTSELRTLAQKHFNKFIRLRDTDDYGYGRCISSGVSLKVPSKNAQAGHFYSSGMFPRLTFNEDNVHLQSLQDNYFKHSNGAEYARNLENKIGKEALERLNQISLDKSPFKWDRINLIETIETYKAKCKDLAKTKMFKV